ncbi:hypothetical protein D3C79_698080 [compost metagenome]
MIEQHDATADVAAAGVVVAGHQRPHPGIGAQNASLRQFRRQQRTFTDQNVHLLRRHHHIVYLVIVDVGGGGANQRDGVTRHQNVGVCRFAATVDHHVVDAVAQDQQCPFGREHADAQIGVLRNLLAPNAGGVDHHLGVDIVAARSLMVENAHAGHAVTHAQ